ncbi:hypothetical protein HW532_00235 [Kaustia mangrovi]|uniref:Uncharacterized protein n=1 Tax=Kaustia mangrovi TaxID=2593653 RepID=A0A7S8HA89_9HYPH|nr:hypothetical protein [Kaustia mangrovi]QPC41307.1 hypothetical protein HW532_00235 [Kaustia mangrovi]
MTKRDAARAGLAAGSRRDCPAGGTCQLLARQPERLVVTGFRCWMAGYEFGDIDCWEHAWRVFSNELGARDGRTAVTDLQFWVRAIRQSSQRPIRCFPACCRHVCRDECMALSAISAMQNDENGTAHMAAHYLTGAESHIAIGHVIDASRDFAHTLAGIGQHLVAVTPEVVEDIASRDEAGPPPVVH